MSGPPRSGVRSLANSGDVPSPYPSGTPDTQPRRRHSFLAVAETTYYFQFSGGANDFTFYLTEAPFTTAPNDNFVDALELRAGAPAGSGSIGDATAELGEPAHLGAVAAKSLWWKWQAATWANCTVYNGGSLATNPVFAVYTGDSVQSLQLVAKGTNGFHLQVAGGAMYYIAAAVPTKAVGDALFYWGVGTISSVHNVAGNLLLEPSWEGTAILGAQHWFWTDNLGGYVNEPGGVDGTTWPVLGLQTKIWQAFTTVPGHRYRVRFACKVGGSLTSCCGDALIAVYWDTNLLGSGAIPAAESGYWHWSEFTITSTNSASQVLFENQGRNVEVDAFSVVDVSAAPQIVNQPVPASTVAGGTAAFTVGVSGSAPLYYQWNFEGNPLPGETNVLLLLTNVGTNQTGNYNVVVTNAFGSATSAPASLFVEAAQAPVIVWQPYGGTRAVGSFFTFTVTAIGTLPFTYQWFANGVAIPEATNETLVFTNLQPSDANAYSVRVQNYAGSVVSLRAPLTISTNIQGGGTVFSANKIGAGSGAVDAPVFDVDGVTKLSGSAYVAQLYAGPSLELLWPAGTVQPFRSNSAAGYFVAQPVTLANVPPEGSAVAQVRVWESAKANSYEEARALGGKFGKSGLVPLACGGALNPPGNLTGLQSFNLQAGLPRFTAASLQPVSLAPDGTPLWSLTGESNYLYLIEQTFGDGAWQPYVVVTNLTGVVTFTSSANATNALVLYRGRILD
jgi:hypothetical protein